jgi:hypothetical protein
VAALTPDADEKSVRGWPGDDDDGYVTDDHAGQREKRQQVRMRPGEQSAHRDIAADHGAGK